MNLKNTHVNDNQINVTNNTSNQHDTNFKR